MNTELIIENLFERFEAIRYVAIYIDENLVFKQKANAENSSAGGTDKFEELLVNPTLLKLASQRGNIDCGGLRFLIVGYGNFYQLVKSLPNGGHLSICLDKSVDLNKLPEEIYTYLRSTHFELGL